MVSNSKIALPNPLLIHRHGTQLMGCWKSNTLGFTLVSLHRGRVLCSEVRLYMACHETPCYNNDLQLYGPSVCLHGPCDPSETVFCSWWYINFNSQDFAMCNWLFSYSGTWPSYFEGIKSLIVVGAVVARIDVKSSCSWQELIGLFCSFFPFSMPAYVQEVAVAPHFGCISVLADVSLGILLTKYGRNPQTELKLSSPLSDCHAVENERHRSSPN